MYMNLMSYYERAAYYINEKNAADGIKLYLRGKREWPKFSCFGLGVRSDRTLKGLSELEIGETFDTYTRVR